jgi:hypothetical protein
MQPSGPSTMQDPAGPQVRRRLARLVTVAILALAMLELSVLVAPGARAASLPTDLPLAALAGHPEVFRLPAPTGPHRVGTLRRPARIGQAGRLHGWGGVGRHPAGPRVPEPSIG